jgi:superfamily I DNA/RNA helicase
VLKPEDLSFATNDVVLYLAPAGSGKTTALMDEMTELLKVYRPDEIAFVTFTRKGVANGIERALRAVPGLTPEDLVYFKTLHALCFRELGLKHENIMTQKHLDELNETLGFKVYRRSAYENQTDDDKLLTIYDARRNGVSAHSRTWRYDEARYERLVSAYEALKAKHRVVDFHDCLLRFRDRGLPVGVKVALIDEVQDLTMLQWEVCKIAFSGCEKIRMSGDDYQSVFEYLGARPETLIALAKKYKTVKLERSYRLPRAVYRLARGLTALMQEKVEKDYAPVKDLEGFVEFAPDRLLLARRIRQDFEKNASLPYRWFLLFRNNCFMQEMEENLEAFTIPYHNASGFCVPKRELARITRYYNYRLAGFGSPEGKENFRRKYGVTDFNRDFTDSSLIPSERKFVYFDYAEKFGVQRLNEMAQAEPFLLLSTPHRVKGGEADFVGVFLDCTKKVRDNMVLNMDEELRVLYVACTRARIGLYIAHSKSWYGLDRILDVVHSRTKEPA